MGKENTTRAADPSCPLCTHLFDSVDVLAVHRPSAMVSSSELFLSDSHRKGLLGKEAYTFLENSGLTASDICVFESRRGSIECPE